MLKPLVILVLCVGGIAHWFHSTTPGEVNSLKRTQADTGGLKPSLALPAVTVEVIRSPLAEQARTGTAVKGRVVDAETNLPIASASVEVSAGEGALHTWTSTSGQYFLEEVQQEQTLRISARGYVSANLQLVQLGLLEDIRLVPEHVVEVLVTWDRGAPVTDAVVEVLLTEQPYQVDERIRERAATTQTDARGIAKIRIPHACQVVARENSGFFGSAFAVPGKRCEIVLEAVGARFSFRSENPDKELRGLRFVLRRLGGDLDDADVPLSEAPEQLALPAGRWMLKAGADSSYVVAAVVRDGVPLFDVWGSAVQFTVLESTTEIEIILKGGLDIRLIDGASGLPVVGPITYRRRIQRDNGGWSDRIPHYGVADSDGRVVLSRIFWDDLNEGRVSLRIDAPGYSPGDVNSREILDARQVPGPRELRLVKSNTTSFVLEYQDGTPFTGPVILEAVRSDAKRELFVGMLILGQHVPPVNLEKGEAIRVGHWSREEIVSRPAREIDLGRTNTVVVDRSYGRLQVLGVPSDATHVGIVGARGDEHALTQKGARLVSSGLFPGVYFLGPLDLARESSVRFGGFGSNSLSFGGRVVKVVVEGGEETSVRWLEAWRETGAIEGVIHVQGTSEGLVLVPIYSRGGQPTAFGASMRKVFLDATGRYRLPQNFVMPDSLAVCSLDVYGVPVPIDVIEPGVDASVSAASLRLNWTGAPGAGHALIKYAIDISAFRERLKMVSNEYELLWDLETPLLLQGIPCGKTSISFQIGNDRIAKTVYLDSRELNHLDVEVP